jgi:hypothetical protein
MIAKSNQSSKAPVFFVWFRKTWDWGLRVLEYTLPVWSVLHRTDWSFYGDQNKRALLTHSTEKLAVAKHRFYFLLLSPPMTRDHPDKSSGHTQTDGIDIQPHTTQTINERSSAESDLVTAQSTAYAPPEKSLMGRPKHVGETPPKCF